MGPRFKNHENLLLEKTLVHYYDTVCLNLSKTQSFKPACGERNFSVSFQKHQRKCINGMLVHHKPPEEFITPHGIEWISGGAAFLLVVAFKSHEHHQFADVCLVFMGSHTDTHTWRETGRYAAHTHTYIYNTNTEKLTHAHTAVCTFTHRNTFRLTERESVLVLQKRKLYFLTKTSYSKPQRESSTKTKLRDKKRLWEIKKNCPFEWSLNTKRLLYFPVN